MTDLGTLLSQHNLRQSTLYAQVLLPAQLPDDTDDIEALSQHYIHETTQGGKRPGYETTPAKSRREEDESQLRKRVFLRVLASGTIIKKVEQATGYKYLQVLSFVPLSTYSLITYNLPSLFIHTASGPTNYRQKDSFSATRAPKIMTTKTSSAQEIFV